LNFRTRQARREPELDLTPLIDVVFLLLIFFLVTATFAQSREHAGLPVDLPEGATGESVAAEGQITVHLHEDGHITVERAGAETIETTDVGDVDRLLREAHQLDPTSSVYLRGDQAVPYGRVMEVLDHARQVGFRQVYNIVYSSTVE
jgi:biopolymer transport protein ExbD